jgi:hypothetical protein
MAFCETHNIKSFHFSVQKYREEIVVEAQQVAQILPVRLTRAQENIFQFFFFAFSSFLFFRLFLL